MQEPHCGWTTLRDPDRRRAATDIDPGRRCTAQAGCARVPAAAFPFCFFTSDQSSSYFSGSVHSYTSEYNLTLRHSPLYASSRVKLLQACAKENIEKKVHRQAFPFELPDQTPKVTKLLIAYNCDQHFLHVAPVAFKPPLEFTEHLIFLNIAPTSNFYQSIEQRANSVIRAHFMNTYIVHLTHSIIHSRTFVVQSQMHAIITRLVMDKVVFRYRHLTF